jgi:2-polyprenyl-3-methyl-5-hydroxy-6-metoxy-1,4-benzoquinol methylase
VSASPIAVESVRCQGCGADGPATVVATGPDYDYHACGDQRFTLVECGACGTYYLNPRPTAAMLPVIYSSDEYYAYEFSESGNPIVLAARRRRDGAKAARVLAQLTKTASELSVLDIGTGDGALLEAFKLAGTPSARLTGLEIDHRAVARLERRGFAGILGRIEETSLEPLSLDVVAMTQVIEHVAEPRSVLAKCYDALTPGGVLLIETPNMAGWDRKIFPGGLWGTYHFPRHWTLWDTKTLPALLRGMHFDVVSVTTLPAAATWAWSLNHVAQHVGAPRWLASLFGFRNPLLLAGLWAIDMIPSVLGRASNMQIIARKPLSAGTGR